MGPRSSSASICEGSTRAREGTEDAKRNEPGWRVAGERGDVRELLMRVADRVAMANVAAGVVEQAKHRDHEHQHDEHGRRMKPRDALANWCLVHTVHSPTKCGHAPASAVGSIGQTATATRVPICAD